MQCPQEGSISVQQLNTCGERRRERKEDKTIQRGEEETTSVEHIDYRMNFDFTLVTEAFEQKNMLCLIHVLFVLLSDVLRNRMKISRGGSREAIEKAI